MFLFLLVKIVYPDQEEFQGISKAFYFLNVGVESSTSLR